VLVRYSGGSFDVRESVSTATGTGYCQLAPSSSCLKTDWETAISLGSSTAASAGLARYRAYPSLGFVPGNLQVFNGVSIGGTYSGSSSFDVCFSPLGRTYARGPAGNSTTLAPLTQVLVFSVGRSDGIGWTRTVLVPPNGTARAGS
jgi:hypothetical protein